MSLTSSTSKDQTVYFGGDVYSSADPFATAIAVAGESVVWVGGDEAAATMTGDHVALREDFVTPGLATAALELGPDAPTPDGLMAAGILHAHIIGTPDQVRAFIQAAGPVRITAYERADCEQDAPAPSAVGGRLAVEAAALSALTAGAAGARWAESEAATGLFVQVRDAAGLDSVLQYLSDPEARTRAQRQQWRLRVSTGIDEAAVAALGTSGLGVTIAPCADDYPVEKLLAAGVQLSFELDAYSPWESLRAAIFGAGENGTTGRAAFNCATRFVHRAVGDFSGGVLAPGTPARLVRWQAGTLVVQAADERIAGWSTDPRSGTAGLPDLTPGRDLPTLVEAYANGVRWTR